MKLDIISLYICPPRLYTVVTVQIIYIISEENKLLPTYPPHLKNVTTLPCEMQPFFICLNLLKVTLHSSECWWLWKKPVVMCSNCYVRQATSQQVFKMTTFCTDTCFQSFCHWSTASSTMLCWNSARVATRRFRNSSVSRIGTRYLRPCSMPQTR